MKEYLVTLIVLYLRFFAVKTLKNHRPTIIGITGTAGKSSARDMINGILKDHYATKVVHGNSETGIPLGIMGIKPKSLGFETFTKSVFDWLTIIFRAPFSTHHLKGVKYLIVEMGIDDPFPPKNMEYLLSIVKPDISIFLNVGAMHTMQFEKLLPNSSKGTRSWFNNDQEKTEYLIGRIADEKAKIITESGCKIGIYNADNSYILETIRQYANKATTLLTFGSKPNNSLTYKKYAVDLHGTTFTFEYANGEIIIQILGYLLPETYRETIAAAILAGLQTGLTIKQIIESLEKNFSLPKGRATLLKGIHDSILIDSSYNASRIAVEGMLGLVSVLKKETKRPTVFIMGDMRELGSETQYEHETVAEKIIGTVDYLYLVGPQTRRYVLPVIQQREDTFREIRWFESSTRAGDHVKETLPEHAIVLIKGSQNTIFLEEAVKLLLNDKSDESKLCRQEDFWMKRKKVISNQ